MLKLMVEVSVLVRKEGRFDYFLVIRRDGRRFQFILDGRTTMAKEPLTAYKVRRVVGGFSHKILKGRLVYRVRRKDLEKALEELSSKDEVTLRIVKTVIEDSDRCIVALCIVRVSEYVKGRIQFGNYNYMMNAYDKTIRNTLNYLIRHRGELDLDTTLRYFRNSLAGIVEPSSQEFDRFLTWAGNDMEALRVFVKNFLADKLTIPTSRLVIINNTVGFYVKPDIVTDESIYVVKGFPLERLLEYAPRQARIFQLAYPRHKAVLIGLNHDGTLEQIKLNPIELNEAIRYLRDLRRLGWEKKNVEIVNLARHYVVSYFVRNNNSLVFDEYPPLYTR